MKKMLLAMAMLSATLIGHSANNNGTSLVELSYPDNVPTITVTIDNDPELQNTTCTSSWNPNMSFEAAFANNAWQNVIIKGTGINQKGLTRMCNAMTQIYDSNVCTLNLTKGSFLGDITSFPNKFTTLLLAPGQELPETTALTESNKLRYAYSDEKDGDKTIHLYVSGQVTSISEIKELTEKEDLGEGWTVFLYGTCDAVRTELENKGVSVKVPYVGAIEVCGDGPLENLIKAQLPEGEDVSSIKKLTIRDHAVNQTELDYLATVLKNALHINLADATLLNDVHFSSTIDVVHWETLILPKGVKISPSFEKYDRLKFAAGGALEKIWIINRGEAGSLSTSGIADLLPVGINNPDNGMRLEVAFAGPINRADIEYLIGNGKAPLSKARIWNFYDAEELAESDFEGLGSLTQGTWDAPTGMVLTPGLDVNKIYDKLNDTWKIGNIYSLSAGDNGRTLTVRIHRTETFDIARFVTLDSRVAVLGNATMDQHIINALKSTKRCISLDLSGMTFPDNSDEILKEVTEGNIIYVKLPSGITFNPKTYEGTIFGAIARIKQENGRNVAVCYQRMPDTLTKIVGYRSPEMLACEYVRYRGLICMHDVRNLLANNKNIYCDMSDTRVIRYKNGAEDENKKPNKFTLDMVEDNPDKDMSLIKNAYVKYLALPEGTSLPKDLEAFKNDNCPLLLAIGTFDKTVRSLTCHSYATEGGEMENVTLMLRDDGDKITKENPVISLTMSGRLNFHDITDGTGSCDANGHYSNVNALGGTGGALNTVGTGMHINLHECDFENAVFPTQDDMTLSAGAVYSNVQAIKLPTSPEMTKIPVGCLSLFKNVTELCIPANFRIISRDAFREMTGLTKITTTAVQEGNITDRGEGTIVLSYNVEEIQKDAFWGIEKMYDIYVLAEKAPKCQSGAFSEAMLWGNNGFHNEHPIRRTNYNNNGKIIGMLHYPRSIVGEPEELNYTDITRKYTLIDETGSLNGEGELYKWPRHEEFGRAYKQATYTVTIDGEERGCNWNAWQEFDGNGALISNITDASLVTATMDNTYDLDYAGWHEFVLAESYYRKADNGEITPNYGKFVEEDWYTICFPYNMTRSQLLTYFGVPEGNEYTTKDGKTEIAKEDIYPDVRTLVEVKRHRNYSATGGRITFVFSKNLMTAYNGEPADVKMDINTITEDNGRFYMEKGKKPWHYVPAEETITKGFEDDPIVVKGGYPYIIKPFAASDGATDDVHFVPVEGKTVGSGNTIMVDNMEIKAPYISHIIHAIDIDNSNDKEEVYATDGDNRYLYHFIGTYGYKNIEDDVEISADKYLPQYSFFLSKTKKNPRHLFYRTMSDNIKWGTFTSIIGGRSSAQFVTSASMTPDITNPKAATSNDVEKNIFVDFTCGNDAFFDQNGKVKNAILDMDFTEENDDTTTGIIELPVQKQPTNGTAVYSMDGRYMGTRMDNLPKGIYVTNGKKYIVK